MPAKPRYQGERALRWIQIDTCLVAYLEAEVDFDDDLWTRWLAALEQPSVQTLLLCSWGPTQPSHQQWRAATRAMRDQKLEVSVVTDARHNMALAKAALWLGTNIESFRWDSLPQACRRIGLSGGAASAARAEIVALRDAFGRVTTDVTLGDASITAHTNYNVSSKVTFDTHNEIQATLEALQKRLQARKRVQTDSSTDTRPD